MAKKNTLELAATGRRKTSVARVRMIEGAGTVTVETLEYVFQQENRLFEPLAAKVKG